MFESLVTHIKKKLSQTPSDAGFSLVELTVVVFIILILVAVSLEYILLATTASQTAGVVNLRGADAAAHALFTDNGGAFATSNNGPLLQAAEPGIQFTTNTISGSYQATHQDTVWYSVANDNASIMFQMYVNKNGGECIALLDILGSNSSLLNNHVFPLPGSYWGVAANDDPTAASSGLITPGTKGCGSPSVGPGVVASSVGWSQTPPN